MIKLPVALQLYSVRNELEANFAETIKRVRALGYDGVEFAGLYGKSAKEVKALVDSLGLVPISAHVPIDEMFSDPDATMETYSRIGCRYVAVPWLGEERRMGGRDYESTVEGFKSFADCAKQHGLTLLYHNHDFELVRVGDKYALDLLYENIPALFAEYDTCWIAVAGEDPAQYIRKHIGRSPVVHLKDYYMPGKKPVKMYELLGADTQADADGSVFEFRPLGRGVQNFPEILSATVEAGAQWVVVEQDEPSMGKTPLECAEISINYLKSL